MMNSCPHALQVPEFPKKKEYDFCSLHGIVCNKYNCKYIFLINAFQKECLLERKK